MQTILTYIELNSNALWWRPSRIARCGIRPPPWLRVQSPEGVHTPSGVFTPLGGMGVRATRGDEEGVKPVCQWG